MQLYQRRLALPTVRLIDALGDVRRHPSAGGDSTEKPQVELEHRRVSIHASESFHARRKPRFIKKMEIWQETWFDTLSCDNNDGKNFHGLNQIEEIEKSSKREKLAINMIDLKAAYFSSQNVWNLQLPISYPSSQHHFHRQRSFARVQKSSENANSQHQVQSTASTEIWHFCFVC